MRKMGLNSVGKGTAIFALAVAPYSRVKTLFSKSTVGCSILDVTIRKCTKALEFLITPLLFQFESEMQSPFGQMQILWDWFELMRTRKQLLEQPNCL